MAMIGEQLVRLLGSLKSKLIRGIRPKKPYTKVGKTESMRVEIRSRQTRKLIEETLDVVDSSGECKSYAF